MQKYIFGADIGGTACKLGLFDARGTLLEKWEIPTDKSEQGTKVLPNVAAALQKKMAEKAIAEEEVYGVGMGVPGAVNKEGFFVCPNLNWESVNARRQMQQLMPGMKVTAINDANAAAFGEMWKGSGVGYRDLVMVTLGTGVGGGIISDGKIVGGAHGGGGEIGGVVVNPYETEVCKSGPKGCLEYYASATGLVTMTEKKLAGLTEQTVLSEVEVITAKAVFDACKSGDKVADEIVDEFCRILAKGLSIITHVVDPEIYVIGGGVSKAGELLLEKVKNAYLEIIEPCFQSTKFVLASLGNDAGMYGAVYSVLEAK